MKVTNLEQAKALVKKYRELKAEDFSSVGILDKRLKELTGFGSAKSCTLCIEARKPGNGSCSGCIHGINGDPFMACCDQDTYSDIVCATTIDEMLEALSARADFIESLIK